MSKKSASERPVFKLLLQPKAGVDGEKALRRILKFALRRCRPRCLSVEQVK
jgi:hypothetical protein